MASFELLTSVSKAKKSTHAMQAEVNQAAKLSLGLAELLTEVDLAPEDIVAAITWFNDLSIQYKTIADTFEALNAEMGKVYQAFEDSMRKSERTRPGFVGRDTTGAYPYDPTSSGSSDIEIPSSTAR